jgi:hypothetical protein
MFTGKTAYDQSGYSVSGAWDVNGDGFDDILIGAPGREETYLIYGNPIKMSGTMALSSEDIVTFTGNVYSGYSVSGTWDVNGDGFDDILIGAPSATGKTYLIYGSPTLSGTMALFSEDIVTFMGKWSNDQSGWSVSGAGDVNSDGFADILIGG